MKKYAILSLLCPLMLFFPIHIEAKSLWGDNGVITASGPGDQADVVIIDDESGIDDLKGNVIIAYTSDISGNDRILMQKLDKLGNILWQNTGVSISTRTGSQGGHTIAPDLTGGCYVFWEDSQGSTSQIFGQKFDKDGKKQWGAAGLQVSATTATQGKPVAIPDGSGGVIVVWGDGRNDDGDNDTDLLAQRFSSLGSPLFPNASGEYLSIALTPDWGSFNVKSDGSGGLYVIWATNEPNQNDNDIFIQHLNGSGQRQWGNYGIALCNASGYQGVPVVTGSSGNIWTAWEDERTAGTAIYSQLLSSSGVPQYAANGVPVSGYSQLAIAPSLVSDGGGGAFLTFIADRFSNRGAYIRRLLPTGAILLQDDSPLYNGKGLSWDGFLPLVSDGAGGCYVTWPDSRSGSTKVYFQHFSSKNEATFDDGGISISEAQNTQTYPDISRYGRDSAIVGFRVYNGSDSDVYLQRVSIKSFPWIIFQPATTNMGN